MRLHATTRTAGTCVRRPTSLFTVKPIAVDFRPNRTSILCSVRAVLDIDVSIATLEAELRGALAVEDYNLAAQLRDSIL